MIKKAFIYLEPLWLGTKNKISIRRVLAIAFSINLIANINFAIVHWDTQKSYSDLAFVLGIEAALIAALLTLTTYTNMIHSRMDRRRGFGDDDYMYDHNRFGNRGRFDDDNEIMG